MTAIGLKKLSSILLKPGEIMLNFVNGMWREKIREWRSPKRMVTMHHNISTVEIKAMFIRDQTEQGSTQVIRPQTTENLG